MDEVVDYYRVLSALSDIYIALFLYNLNDDTHVGIKSNKFIDMWSSDYLGNGDKTNNVMRNIAVESDVEKILEFVNLETLDERMSEKNVISETFEGKVNGPCRAVFVGVDRNADMSLHHVLFMVESI